MTGCLVTAPSVMAQSRKDELKRVESTLQKEKENRKQLERDQADLQKKLDAVRDDMIRITRHVQDQEKAVLALQEKQVKTEEEIAASREKLDRQRDSLARVVLALQRISRVPPQAMLARPTAPIDMARSSYLLEQVIPSVSEQAAEIKNVLTTLDALLIDQHAQAKELNEKQASLQKKQSGLEKMVKKRETLLAVNSKAQIKSRRETDALARKAKDLRDLMQRLEQEERQAAVAAAAAQRKKMAAHKTASLPVSTTPLGSSSKGLIRSLKSWFGGSAGLPVAGDVVTGYGDALPGGGMSRGLRIKATGGAVVTAPLGGVVRFAGPFRQYRLLVIIQHDNGDHSLLGGLQELYTKTGARIAKGEPLGKLEKLEGDSTRASSLYYERRRNGKPIDPRRV